MESISATYSTGPLALIVLLLDQLLQNPTIDSLDLPTTLDEVKEAISQTSTGKAFGTDGIPTEIKSAGLVTLKTFHHILISIWEDEDMPKDFRDATIVLFFKNKGSKSDCGNYRGISFLFTAWKILAHVVFNHLVTSISEGNLPEDAVPLSWS